MTPTEMIRTTRPFALLLALAALSAPAAAQDKDTIQLKDGTSDSS